MRINRNPTRGVLVLAAALASLPNVYAVARAQSATGYRASWGDLETWSRLIESSRENEVGVGLQAAGPGGVMFVAFTARIDTREPNVPPREVVVQVATPPRTNPNAIHTPTLSFTVDEKTDKRAVIDLTSRLTVDNPAPGSELKDGTARMRLPDFTRILNAETVKANVFGLDVTLRPDQIRAIRAFAERLRLLPAKTP